MCFGGIVQLVCYVFNLSHNGLTIALTQATAKLAHELVGVPPQQLQSQALSLGLRILHRQASPLFSNLSCRAHMHPLHLPVLFAVPGAAALVHTARQSLGIADERSAAGLVASSDLHEHAASTLLPQEGHMHAAPWHHTVQRQ